MIGGELMNHFTQIGEALKYIDTHLNEPISLELLAEEFSFSPFYFHRLFSAVVGRPLAAYIRDRRILYTCKQLCNTEKSILEIALDNGFQSSQAFSRAFREVQGMSPSEYRKQGYQPTIITADEVVMKFTNRLRGGTFLNPKIIKRSSLLIAGVSGDGNQTWEIWQAFAKLSGEKPLDNLCSEDGYEIRIYDGEKCTVHVGKLVTNRKVDPAYTVFELPASKYASFDVYVAHGYDSENSAMNEWLDANGQGCSEKLLNDTLHYCVEYYDERFQGNETNSIVEIWIPIK